MNSCIIHGGKYGENATCTKCQTCKHESAWRRIDTEPVVMPELPSDLINKERATTYAKRDQVYKEGQRLERNLTTLWKCNGCYRSFSDDEYTGTRSVLFNGVWSDYARFKACEYCHTLFIAKRSDALYCSDACKLKASRER